MFASLKVCIQITISFAVIGYFHDGIFLHFCASMISGLVTTTASMPVDIAKTRIQNMKVIDGKPEYKGAVVSITSTYLLSSVTSRSFS